MSPSIDGVQPSKIISRSSTTHSGAVKGDVDFGYPSGHLGHLTPDEETTLKAFKAVLATNDLYTPTTPTTLPSHDDATLLRFLRARRWDVPAAHAQFAATAAWRRAMDLETLYDTIDVAAYEASWRLYPQWTGRRDKRGIPIYLYEIVHLDAKTVAAWEKAEVYSRAAVAGATNKDREQAKMVRLFALYENLTRFAQPLCSQLGDREYAGRTPVTLSTNIVDVTGVTLKMYWNLKNHMQSASELAQAHYPETLDRIFVIGAPGYFTTVWSWIKRWFDPVTVSKIFILAPHEVLPTLKSFMDVKNIPKKYGGELEYTWNDRPKLDDTILSAVEWANGYSDFPEGPLYWVPVDGGKRLQCLARGSINKKDRNEVVGSIAVTVPPVLKEAPVEEEEAAPVAVNGNGVVATEPVGDAPPAAAGAADSSAVSKTEEQPKLLAVPDAASPAVASPTSDTFHDAAEEPLAPPTAVAPEEVAPPLASPAPPAEVLVPGVEGLVLGEPNEKVLVEEIPNGKVVSAAT